MQGLFKVSNDPTFTAVFIDETSTVLFPGSGGFSHRDSARFGAMEEIYEDARFVKSGDETLLEGVDALKSNRPPRWALKNF